MMSLTVTAKRGSRTSASRNACPCWLPCGPSPSATTACVLKASRIAVIAFRGTAGFGLAVACRSAATTRTGPDITRKTAHRRNVMSYDRSPIRAIPLRNLIRAGRLQQITVGHHIHAVIARGVDVPQQVAVRPIDFDQPAGRAVRSARDG